MPRSLARRTRPTRKLSSRFGGTLPAKTTAVAYSIKYSRRLENSLASAWVTSGPYSLISVGVPAIGSTIAVEVREYRSIATRSNGMVASERPSRMASPLRPPANPVARTGTSRVLRDLATLTPFPPASVMLSGALCLWPSVRLGTTSVLATAALRVTVSIMPLPTCLLFENPLNGIPYPLPERGLFVTLLCEKPGLPDFLPIDLYDEFTEPDSYPGRVRQILYQVDIALHVGTRVHETIHAVLRHKIYTLLPPVSPCSKLRVPYRDYDDPGSTTRSMVADTILMSCASSDLVRRVRETPGHRLLRRVGRRVVLPYFRQCRDWHGLAHATPTSPERGRQCPRIQGEERGRPRLRALEPRCLRTHLLEYPQ